MNKTLLKTQYDLFLASSKEVRKQMKDIMVYNWIKDAAELYHTVKTIDDGYEKLFDSLGKKFIDNLPE